MFDEVEEIHRLQDELTRVWGKVKIDCLRGLCKVTSPTGQVYEARTLVEALQKAWKEAQ